MPKIIFLDWGFLMFRAIFACVDKPHATIYMALNMMIANLQRVGLDKEDKVIIAVDSPRGSWRKEVDSNYKANRKALRQKTNVDWKMQFKKFNNLVEKLEAYSPFHTICIEKLEADDIISYGCRKFKNNTCIIISSDSDYEQLCALENVKLFSPITKRYKKVLNPYEILAKKIQKETADNLVTKIRNEYDYQKRKKIVDLIELPKEVDDKIEDEINFLPDKDWLISELPCQNLHERFERIYEKDKVVDENKPKRKKRRKKNESNSDK